MDMKDNGGWGGVFGTVYPSHLQQLIIFSANQFYRWTTYSSMVPIVDMLTFCLL